MTVYVDYPALAAARRKLALAEETIARQREVIAMQARANDALLATIFAGLRQEGSVK